MSDFFPPSVIWCSDVMVGRWRRPRRGRDDGSRKDLFAVYGFVLLVTPHTVKFKCSGPPGFSETNTEAAKQGEMRRNLSKLGM